MPKSIRISFSLLPDLIKKATGAKNVIFKEFKDLSGKVYKGKELKELIKRNTEKEAIKNDS